MTGVVEVTRRETLVIEGRERLEVVEVARQGMPGPPGVVDAAAVDSAVRDWLADNSVLAVTRVAGETLSALKGVWEDDAGAVWSLDASDSAHITLFAGVTITAATAGGNVTVQRSGVLDAGGLNLTPGPVWLGVDGALTQTRPAAGFSLLLGAATAASRLILSPSLPIRLE
jgi:hypothetical protein